MEKGSGTIEKLGLKRTELYLGIDFVAFETLAASFAERLTGGEIVLFFGDLGTGKTTFIRKVSESLGVLPEHVRSPTFTIANAYQGSDLDIYHIDVYRISGDELIDLGFYDYCYERSVVFVEWAEKIVDWVDDIDYIVELSIQEEKLEKRNISIYTGTGD